MQSDLLNQFGFDDKQTAARTLLLAGLFDQLLFKHELTPEVVSAAGIPLHHLLPRHAIVPFRTERLNRLFKGARGVLEQRRALLAGWLGHWDELGLRGLRLQIDASQDKSVLIDAGFLATLFGAQLLELGGVTIRRRRTPIIAREPSLKILMEGNFRFGSPAVAPTIFPRVDADVADLAPGLLIVGPREQGVNALTSFLSNPARPTAHAAIFVQTEPERDEVTARLLDAAMEESGLVFAAAVHADLDNSGAWLGLISRSYRHQGTLDRLLIEQFRQYRPRFAPDNDVAPLILVGDGFLDDELIDCRKYVESLLREQAIDFGNLDDWDAYAAAPMASEFAGLQHIPAVRRALKKRYVQTHIRPQDGALPTLLLHPSSNYVVELFLGAVLSSSIVASAPLPADWSEFNNGAEELTVLFNPLYVGIDGAYAAGQIASLILPREGASNSVHFTLRTPDNLRAFRARVVILHRSAVLQTLILALEPIAGDRDLGLPYRLVVESIVTPATALARPAEFAFDLTMVLNDNLDGAPGMTVLQQQKCLFTQPNGWEDFVRDIQATLSRSTDNPAMADGTDELDFAKTVREIARAGITALHHLKLQVPDVDFSAAHNLQVVEAVSGVFLPVEFFYDGPSPNEDADICSHGSAHCCNVKSKAIICPSWFWGLSKRIERKRPLPYQQGVEIRIPKQAPVLRRSLDAALLGASDKVMKGDLEDLRVSLGRSCERVYCVSDWDSWSETVRTRSPELLVLLPHTVPHPQGKSQLAMEIHGAYARYSEMNEVFVLIKGAPAPVVLLLGCETAVPKQRQFMNFASDFYARGALLVIATLSDVRGRHVARVAGDLAARLKARDSASPGDFGNTFLALKQELFAAGNALGLTMIAYGDTTWEMDNA